MVLYISTGYWVLSIVCLDQLKGARHTHISYHDKQPMKYAPQFQLKLFLFNLSAVLGLRLRDLSGKKMSQSWLHLVTLVMIWTWKWQLKLKNWMWLWVDIHTLSFGQVSMSLVLIILLNTQMRTKLVLFKDSLCNVKT